MRVEVPLVKRCCLCLPLRYGILAWGYINLAVTIFFTVIWGIQICIRRHRQHDPTERAIFWVLAVMIPLELIFNLMQIVAAHKKSYKVLRVVYYCIIADTATLVLVKASHIVGTVCTYISYGIPIYYASYYFVMFGGYVIFSTILQVYLILLVRSELVKLRDSASEVSFVNHGIEARCVLRASDHVHENMLRHVECEHSGELNEEELEYV